ncbi:MAG: copper amine oxidase N-terminal domain-containing protein [Syntrophomonadaceae bacterium]
MTLKKAWISGVSLAVAMLVMLTALPAQATIIDMYIGQQEMYIDAYDSVTLDAAPYIKGGRTMVPLSAIALAFGANVSAYGTEDGLQARIEYRNCDLFLTVGDRGAHFVNEFGNDVAQTMDVAPEIRNNRMMVPIGVIAMGFGANVSWDPYLQLITIEN